MPAAIDRSTQVLDRQIGSEECIVTQWAARNKLDCPPGLSLCFYLLRGGLAGRGSHCGRSLDGTFGTVCFAFCLSAWSLYQGVKATVPVTPVPVCHPGAAVVQRRIAKFGNYKLRTAQTRRANPESVRMRRAAVQLLDIALTFPEGRFGRELRETPQREQAQWKEATISDLSQKGPIHKRVTAWHTCVSWCGTEGIDPLKAQSVSFRRFISRPALSPKHANAATTRWDVCEWSRRHIDAPIPTQTVPRPTRTPPPGEQSQAAALGPEVYFLVD